MIIEHVEQGSEPWLTWRKSGVGASEIAAVLGISPFKTAHGLWQEKTGAVEGFKGNAATQRGSDLEEVACEAYGDVKGNTKVNTANTCLTHDSYTFIKASLDGWIDDETIIEIKCPLAKNYEAMKEEVPAYYIAQMQQQMLVSGARRCVFWVFDPELGGYATMVEADSEYFEIIIKAATDFWHKVEMFTWQSGGIDELINELAHRKAIETAATEGRKAIESELMKQLQSEGIKAAASDVAKVTLVSRKVVDKDACALNADWLAASNMASEGKADMAAIEKAYKKDGASYIKLTLAA